MSSSDTKLLSNSPSSYITKNCCGIASMTSFKRQHNSSTEDGFSGRRENTKRASDQARLQRERVERAITVKHSLVNEHRVTNLLQQLVKEKTNCKNEELIAECTQTLSYY